VLPCGEYYNESQVIYILKTLSCHFFNSDHKYVINQMCHAYIKKTKLCIVIEFNVSLVAQSV
jgi:hypothetical protein